MSAEIETIHKPFLAWLDTQPVRYSYNRSDKPTTAKWPEADFIVYRGGHCLHLEAKDKDTPISASQKKRHEMLAEVGVRVFIFRSEEQGRELVNAWLSMIGEAGPARPLATGRFHIGTTREHGSSILDSNGMFIRKALPDDFRHYTSKP